MARSLLLVCGVLLTSASCDRRGDEPVPNQSPEEEISPALTGARTIAVTGTTSDSDGVSVDGVIAWRSSGNVVTWQAKVPLEMETPGGDLGSVDAQAAVSRIVSKALLEASARSCPTPTRE